MESFSDWIERNNYWKREREGGGGPWPFGYAVDQQQAASSTLQQAKTLFLEAEDRDINTKSLKMNGLEKIYWPADVADTMAVADTSLRVINLVTNQKLATLQRGTASAQFAISQLRSLLQSKQRKWLLFISMLRAHRKDE